MTNHSLRPVIGRKLKNIVPRSPPKDVRGFPKIRLIVVAICPSYAFELSANKKEARVLRSKPLVHFNRFERRDCLPLFGRRVELVFLEACFVIHGGRWFQQIGHDRIDFGWRFGLDKSAPARNLGFAGIANRQLQPI